MEEKDKIPEETVSDESPAKKKKEKKNKKVKKAQLTIQVPGGKATGSFLHFLQHVCLVGAVVAAAIVFLGSYVVVETKDDSEIYQMNAEKNNIEFEDSKLFNTMLGNSVYDIVCYGTIRSQMETNGVFDPKKEVDVTAFADRYNGIQSEYITADYYLDDLIKWAQNGFEYENIYMTGEEADKFLSRSRTVTKVNFENGNYSGGTVSYLNSDLKSHTKVVDVSGNILYSDNPFRSDVTATVMNNRYRSVDGKKIENYVSSWDEYYELRDNVKKSAEDLKTNYEEYLNYNEFYKAENTNLIYYIRKTIGDNTEVISNQKLSSKELSFLEKKLKAECDKYIIYDPAHMVYETNTLIEESSLRYILNGFEYAYPEDTQILVGVKGVYDTGDMFSQARAGFDNYSPYFGMYLAAAVLGVMLYLFLLVILTMKEGGAIRKDTEERIIRLKPEDRIPTEIILLLVAAVVGIFYQLFEILVYGIGMDSLISADTMPELAGFMALIVSMIFSFFYYSMVRRIKAHTLWSDSLLKRLCEKIKNWLFFVYDNGSVVLRVWVPFGIFAVINIGMVAISVGSGSGVGVLVVLVLDILAGIVLFKSAKARQQILYGIKQINDGDMEHKIDESALHGDNLVLAKAINNIGDGIRNAVATSMKDERMKADLITNVSHDIKTPLTSIINYVDLIKRENVENPKVREYIEVLDVKSQRLKQLTDDLVEASKISSGNIVLQWEKINLVELLNQTIGEFSEKFEQKALIPVLRAKQNSLFIEADSRRIWRVIENLFNNIFKYALEGTRVYIDIEELRKENEKPQVILSIRNISANPLKVDTAELTERFIRGDESRTTEGSGLGLSIAKNLTEVQRGKFEILVDGDLFKVILTFPLLEQK